MKTGFATAVCALCVTGGLSAAAAGRAAPPHPRAAVMHVHPAPPQTLLRHTSPAGVVALNGADPAFRRGIPSAAPGGLVKPAPFAGRIRKR